MSKLWLSRLGVGFLLSRPLIKLPGRSDRSKGDFTRVGEEGTMSQLLVLDLLGTFVFAISGARVGVTRRLDLFGVLFLSFVAGNFGGITRDVLIGSVPAAAISDWRYLAISLLAGVITFRCIPRSIDCGAPFLYSTPLDWRFSLCQGLRRRSRSGSTRSWRRCLGC
jgi:hypothetical protein